LTAGVMVVDRENQIACGAVVVCAILANTTRRLRFQLFKRLVNGFTMGFDQALIPTHFGHDGKRFWSGDGEIVQIAPTALYVPVRSNPIRTVALAKKFAALWLKSLPDCLELL